jgi:hypothetical protein
MNDLVLCGSGSRENHGSIFLSPRFWLSLAKTRGSAVHNIGLYLLDVFCLFEASQINFLSYVPRIIFKVFSSKWLDSVASCYATVLKNNACSKYKEREMSPINYFTYSHAGNFRGPKVGKRQFNREHIRMDKQANVRTWNGDVTFSA